MQFAWGCLHALRSYAGWAQLLGTAYYTMTDEAGRCRSAILEYFRHHLMALNAQIRLDS